MRASSYSSYRNRRRRERRVLTAVLLTLLALVLLAAFFLFRNSEASSEEARAPEEVYTQALTPETGGKDNVPQAWSTKPSAVRGIYLTGAMAGGPNLDAYIDLANETEVNAMVVDVKEGGELTYPSEVPLAKEIGATSDYIPDLEKVVRRLKDNDIYAIARLAVFQDDILARERPELAVMNSVTGGPWVNYNDVAWTNAYRKEVWEYNVAIAKEAAEAGFDEIQFDYIRFPSDGPMDQLDYGEETFPTQEDAIAGFLKYAHGKLEPTGVEVAADVFGLVGHNDNGGIGQRVSKMVPYLDVLCPMVYPSHYGPGSYGFPNPNAEPYGVIQVSMEEFQQKARKANPDLELRPWLQDFDMGVPDYGPAEVKAQMQATYDLGLTGWLLWNAGSEFSADALAPEGAENVPNEPVKAEEDQDKDSQYAKNAGEPTE